MTYDLLECRYEPPTQKKNWLKLHTLWQNTIICVQLQQRCHRAHITETEEEWGR